MSAAERRRDDGIEVLLEEQLAYYRARAPEYTATALPDVGDTVLADGWRALVAALDAASPLGDVLELACGPGTWTAQLLRHADSVTAVDGAPELLRLAAAKVQDDGFGSSAPIYLTGRPTLPTTSCSSDPGSPMFQSSDSRRSRSTVASCLRPAGRVLFVDDAYRTPDELINGEESSTIRRQLTNGTASRAVKVAHTPAASRTASSRSAGKINVTQMPGPFFWGAGSLS